MQSVNSMHCLLTSAIYQQEVTVSCKAEERVSGGGAHVAGIPAGDEAADLLVLLVQARAQLLRGVQRLASQAEGLSAAS